MDSSFYLNKLFEKPNKILRGIALLILFCSFASHLKFFINFMTQFFHDLKIVLLSHSFVFILGNVIIFTLFSMSGYFSSNKADEFMQKREGLFQSRLHKTASEKSNYASTVKLEKMVLLQRSTTVYTEKVRSRCPEKVMISSMFPEDSMSNDEFRRKIEGFIARQKRILREDGMESSTIK